MKPRFVQCCKAIVSFVCAAIPSSSLQYCRLFCSQKRIGTWISFLAILVPATDKICRLSRPFRISFCHPEGNFIHQAVTHSPRALSRGVVSCVELDSPLYLSPSSIYIRRSTHLKLWLRIFGRAKQWFSSWLVNSILLLLDSVFVRVRISTASEWVLLSNCREHQVVEKSHFCLEHWIQTAISWQRDHRCKSPQEYSLLILCAQLSTLQFPSFYVFQPLWISPLLSPFTFYHRRLVSSIRAEGETRLWIGSH